MFLGVRTVLFVVFYGVVMGGGGGGGGGGGVVGASFWDPVENDNPQVLRSDDGSSGSDDDGSCSEARLHHHPFSLLCLPGNKKPGILDTARLWLVGCHFCAMVQYICVHTCFAPLGQSIQGVILRGC